MSKKSFEEMSESGDERLCKYCPCMKEGTELYSQISGPNSIGCEGAYCDSAYEVYLESDDDKEV